MEELISKLNTLLSSIYVQRANIQAAHWNIKGCHAFITFHNYYGELYDYNSTHIDMLAEFVRIYGGTPTSTLTAFLVQSTVSEASAPAVNDVQASIQENLLSNANIHAQLMGVFKASDEAPDVNDYMAAMIADFGKRSWFLRSSSKVEPAKPSANLGEGLVKPEA